MNFFQTSYELLQTSHELHTNFLRTSFKFLSNFLMNFLQNSYEFLTNFLCTRRNSSVKRDKVNENKLNDPEFDSGPGKHLALVPH
jgi:hypothetical protein